jgi:transitional endoplasmic reticulum ATPase
MIPINNALTTRNILVVGASNEQSKIDPAALRTGRFDRKIYIGPPDETAKEEMLKLHLRDRWSDGNIDFSKISKLLKNYTASDIPVYVNQAALNAKAKNEPISTAILEETLATFNPRLTEKEDRAIFDGMYS